MMVTGALNVLVSRKVAALLLVTGPLNVVVPYVVKGVFIDTKEVPLKWTGPLTFVNPLLKVTALKVCKGQ